MLVGAGLNYGQLSSLAKVALIVCMLAGRLELYIHRGGSSGPLIFRKWPGDRFFTGKENGAGKLSYAIDQAVV